MSGSQFHLREVNRPNTFASYGFVGMAGRVGADLRLDLAPAVGEGLKVGRDFNWTKVPDGIIFKEIPHLEPINTLKTWMLNIAKFKCHPLGMTLCCKNLQGSVAHNYQRFCNYSIYSDKHFHKNARKNVEANYKRHCKEAVIPRWDRPGNTGGKWLETWATRTLDNVSATPCALHIIEGIFGRDGNAATGGPHPLDKEHNYNFLGGSRTGSAEDYMSNVIIFGRDIFRVDIIGHWFGGHEPGNFGLFHLAIERGLSHALDPSKIPVYLWDNGSAVRLPLEKFERTSLLSMYLRKDYNGGKEPFYHQVDEPFDYNRVSGFDSPAEVEKPMVFVLYRNSLSPINPYISIEYRLPQKGNVRLEILDGDGHVAAVPAEGLFESGAHLAAWDTSGSKAGTYSYRLRYGDTEIKDNLILN